MLQLQTVLKMIIKIEINRICHRSPMQTEKSQPEGERIMPKTRFIEFPALFVDPRVGLPRSSSGWAFSVFIGLGFFGLHRVGLSRSSSETDD